jgi:hypothetical protein
MPIYGHVNQQRSLPAKKENTYSEGLILYDAVAVGCTTTPRIDPLSRRRIRMRTIVNPQYGSSRSCSCPLDLALEILDFYQCKTSCNGCKYGRALVRRHWHREPRLIWPGKHVLLSQQQTGEQPEDTELWKPDKGTRLQVRYANARN